MIRENSMSLAQLLVTVSCLFTSTVLAQDSSYALDLETKTQIIEAAATIFEREHVIPEIGMKYAEALRDNLAKGVFDEVSNGRDFMIAIDKILWPIDTDGHVWLNFYQEDIPENYVGDRIDIPPEQAAEAEALAKQRNFGIEKIERLRGNIGYIDYRSFTDAQGSDDAFAAAMNLLQHTGALIIDLRNNGGGSPEVVTLFTSYLLDSQNALIGTFVDRDGLVTDEFRTRNEVLGARYGEQRPVYVLISRNTYSAAEAFTYGLQARDRVRVIGDATQGGSRPNNTYRLHARFMLAVPVLRSIDAATNSDYEESGVVPDFIVPSKEALSFAYIRALKELIADSEDSPSRRERELVLNELTTPESN